MKPNQTKPSVGEILKRILHYFLKINEGECIWGFYNHPLKFSEEFVAMVW